MTEIKKGRSDVDSILLQRERLQIVLQLDNNPMYISELSRALRMDPRLLRYHLRILERSGYLECVYEISNNPSTKGRTLCIFSVTKKAKMRLEALKELLKPRDI